MSFLSSITNGITSHLSNTMKMAEGLVKGDLKSVTEGALGLAGSSPLLDILKSDTAKSIGTVLAPLAKAFDEIMPDAGDIVEDLCDELLPEELSWVGDTLSLLTNLETGNIPAVLCDSVELFNDITGDTDPGIPPTKTSSDSEVNVEAPIDHGHRVQHAPIEQPSCKAPDGGDSKPSTPSRTGGCGGDIDRAGPAQETKPSAPPSGSNTSSSKGTEKSELTEKQEAEKLGRDAAKKFIADNKDPESFMAAVRDGTIPDDVMGSQAGMMMIQQRMEQISRMFQMMTQMMDSMHKIQMEIVRNIHG